jgi:predicted dehydrogenase
VIRLANGVIIDSWLSYELPAPGLPTRYTHFLIVGSAGLIDLDAYGQVRLGTDDGWSTVYEQPPFDPTDPRDPARLAAWVAMYQDFVDAVREGRTPPVTGHDGRAAVEIGEAADISNATHQAVRLPLDARPPEPIWSTWAAR